MNRYSGFPKYEFHPHNSLLRNCAAKIRTLFSGLKFFANFFYLFSKKNLVPQLTLAESGHENQKRPKTISVISLSEKKFQSENTILDL